MTKSPIKLPDDLLPGDVLLYSHTSLMSWLIRIKTWSQISHVEVYWGAGKAAASRDGHGVNIYPFDATVAVVLRPKVAFNKEQADAWLQGEIGKPYGWLDLLRFITIKVPDEHGYICSQFADLLERAGGVLAFSYKFDAGAVAPGEFLESAALDEIYNRLT